MPEMVHDWLNNSILFYSILYFYATNKSRTGVSHRLEKHSQRVLYFSREVATVIDRNDEA